MDSLNWLGIILIMFGISYLTYSSIFRNKPTIYFKNIKIVKGKENEYLKIQLYFSIFNAFIVVFIGSIMVIYNLHPPYLMFTPLLVHLVNSIMKQISKTKGYVES